MIKVDSKEVIKLNRLVNIEDWEREMQRFSFFIIVLDTKMWFKKAQKDKYKSH